MRFYDVIEAGDTTYEVADNMCLYVPPGGALTANNGPQFNFSSAFTLVVEFLLLRIVGPTDWLIGKGTNATAPVRYNATLRPVAGLANSSALYVATVSGSIRPAETTHDINDLERHKYVITRDAGFTIRIYLDGALIFTSSTGNHPGDFSTNTAPFSLGAFSGNSFHGILYKAAAFGRELNQAEVTEFQLTNVLPDDELRLLLPFNEASGNVCLDASSNETPASLSAYPAGVTEEGGYSRVHEDGILTFRAFLDAAHPARLSRTFTAARDLTITRAVRVVSTSLTLNWVHKRGGEVLASGTWTFTSAPETQTVNLALLTGDTLEMAAANLTTSAAVFLIYPTLAI